MERAEWLKDVSIFRDLSSEELQKIAGILEERRFGAGDVVYSQNEKGGSLYIVKSGRLRVYRTGKEKEVQLAILGEKDIFGEMSFLRENPHTANIAAMEDTGVLVLDKKRFEELADSDPRVAYLITRNLLLVIESIVRKMNADYVSLMEYMYIFGK